MSKTIGQILCRAFDAPPKTIAITVEAHCAKKVRVTFEHYNNPVKKAANRRTLIRHTTVREVLPRLLPVCARLAAVVPVKVVCPECCETSTLAELFATAVLRHFAQCPKCGIGSPPSEWGAP